MLRRKEGDQRVGIIVQARMGSERLPGKVLKPILGKSMLFYLVERLKRCETVDCIVIATSNKASDDVIVQAARDMEVIGFAGACNENDVLSRYVQAARVYDIDVIVRITADCPLMDPALIDEMVSMYDSLAVDYVANCMPHTLPLGFAIEVFSRVALEKSDSLSNDVREREHVVLPMRNNADTFEIVNKEAPHDLKRSDLRVTVDTEEDFTVVENIFRELYPKNPLFTIRDVLAFLDAHPEVQAVNAHVKQKTE